MITSGCATYEPWASALGGIVGGLLVLPGSLFVLHVLKVDDPVDAVTVHYIGITMHAQHVCFSCLDHHLELHMLQVCNPESPAAKMHIMCDTVQSSHLHNIWS